MILAVLCKVSSGYVNSPVSHPEETEESGDPKAMQAQIIDGGDGGDLNSTTLENPILLVFSLLDQLATLGDTAKQLRQVFRNYNPKSKNLLSNILKIEERVK
jgi:hypothetical protein